ncbi:MAG: radical SAM protein [Lachnospiraceae bacterium]|nr:radical SAM protein [Lachnospiraceae bacterium]
MIKRFFECLVPISKCNLRCEYCYVIQENRRNISTPEITYSMEDWETAVSMERVGKSFFSFCGYGETLITKEPFLKIIISTLKIGHVVNITSNGTISASIDYLLELSKELQSNLLFSFSLHYDELKKRKMLDIFAENVNKVMHSEASCFVQINLCDSYIAEIDEIKDYCIKEFGCLPQVALTRREGEEYSIFSDFSPKEYERYGKSFDSQLFSCTFKNFNVKRLEFCHAGANTFRLDLADGGLRRCYAEEPFMNIFDKTIKEIPDLPVGRHCRSDYCTNSSHFLSLGAISDFDCISYAGLRNREVGWIKNGVLEELSEKICINNEDIEINFANAGDVVIYGAGVTAKDTLHYLKSIQVVPQFFVVTDFSGGYEEPKEICGIKVVGLDEVKALLADKTIIIAIKDYSVIHKIETMLNKEGITKIYNYYNILAQDNYGTYE